MRSLRRSTTQAQKTLQDEYRGSQSQYWITVRDGEVVAIDEQYLPLALQGSDDVREPLTSRVEVIVVVHQPTDARTRPRPGKVTHDDARLGEPCDDLADSSTGTRQETSVARSSGTTTSARRRRARPAALGHLGRPLESPLGERSERRPKTRPRAHWA